MQVPEDRGLSILVVKVSIDHCTAPLAWARACSVPADMLPGTPCGGCQVACLAAYIVVMGQDTHIFNGGVDAGGRNQKPRWGTVRIPGSMRRNGPLPLNGGS